MESYGHLRGARLRSSPFGVDVKRSVDVSPSPQEKTLKVPELLALQNEFAIQNERLERWGFEWTDMNRNLDPSDAPRSGLSETVSTVLKHIRDILNEADQLRSGETVSMGNDAFGFGDQKTKIYLPKSDTRWTAEDRERFGKLATDLKDSIELLYELSSVQKRLHDGSYPTTGKGKTETQAPIPTSKTPFTAHSYNASEETLVNPSRTSTSKTASSLMLPERLDPHMFNLPDEEPPPYDTIGATQSSRMVAFLRSSSEKGVNAGVVPVLVEYAPFDPAYRVTDVPVPQERLNRLLNYLARAAAMADYSAYGSLPCIGFFEDPKEPRFALVYKLPDSVVGAEPTRAKKEEYKPVSLLKILQAASKALNGSASRLIATGPPLEDRFRLAFNVVQAFSRMHLEEGLMHKDVNSGNIIFFKTGKTSSSSEDKDKPEYDLRTPYVTSFDLFSEHSLEKLSTEPKRNIYRHPEDPRTLKDSCNTCRTPQCKCSKARFDLYGLALIMLEIGLWTPIADVFKQRYSLAEFKDRIERIWVKKLPSKCGTIYSNVVNDMLTASSKDVSEDELRTLYTKWLSKMQRCLMIDEEEENIPSHDSSPAASFGALGLSRQKTPPQSQPSQSLPQLSPENPFTLLHQLPSALSSLVSNNPFSKLTSRTALPFAIKEEAPGAWSASLEGSVHGAEGEYIPDLTRNDTGDLSIPSTSTRYQKAAQVIQRAWRSKSKTYSFREYRRKVIVIQKCWRKRQQRRASHGPTIMEPVIEMQQRTIDENTLITISHQQLPPRPKLRIQPVKMQPEILDIWHEAMLPRLERILDRVLRDSDETVSIDLVSLGETILSARPTIFVTCSSVPRVKHAINRKFHYDPTTFDLKVRRGRIRRSKVTRSRKTPPPHRSMANEAFSDAEVTPLNPFHQQRPLCGASIGAFVGKHLPPVSFGGVVNVDGEPYGMSVHHLLDAPSDDDDSDCEDTGPGATRSSARFRDDNPWLAGFGGHPTLQSLPTDSMFPLEISDDDLESESENEEEMYSDDGYSSSEDDAHSLKTTNTGGTDGTQGDLLGIQPGDGTDIVVTQPALDDVDDDFFPCMEDRDDDHLDSHHLGYIHASSGIRRWNRKGICHEIDWALLKLDRERLQPFNLVQGGKRFFKDAGKKFHPKLVKPICRGASYKPNEDEFPNQIARAEELGNLAVHCIGRTSGLQGGVIGPAMSSVRIYRRRSFSRSWHVVGDFGVGGDSGAWVLSNDTGAVCGHVLAWCERNAIAYICPMEVLLEDIKRTLGAHRLSLPGGPDIRDMASGPGLVIEGVPLHPRSAENGQHDKLLEGAKVDEKVDDMDGLPDIGRLDFGAGPPRVRVGKGRDEAFRSKTSLKGLPGAPIELRILGGSGQFA